MFTTRLALTADTKEPELRESLRSVRAKHRLILYHHVPHFDRFWAVSMHPLSQSKSIPRTRLVDAQHAVTRGEMTLLQATKRIQEVRTGTSNSGSANQRFESSLPSHVMSQVMVPTCLGT